MMTVAELARDTRLSTDTIRYYVRVGLLSPDRKKENSYRLFTHLDAKKLKFIHQAKQLGYTLKEIRKILEESASGESPCPIVREIIQNRIEENRQKLVELHALQQRMENALEQWNQMPNGIPDGDCICHLIESVIDEE